MTVASAGANPTITTRGEMIISLVLRSGVLLSVALVAFGTALSFVHHGDYRSSTQALDRLTRDGATFPTTPGEVAAAVVDLRGQGFVALGLLVLIATPMLRVAVSVILFAVEQDRVFTALTSIVLVLLLLSLVLGKAAA